MRGFLFLLLLVCAASCGKAMPPDSAAMETALAGGDGADLPKEASAAALPADATALAADASAVDAAAGASDTTATK